MDGLFSKFKSRDRSGLSVNSLSKISENFVSFGNKASQGETIKTVSAGAALVLCAWFCADLCALMFEKYLPSPPVSFLAGRSRNAMNTYPGDYEVISTRNLFSSKAPKQNTNEIDLESEPTATTLPLTLVGTVIFQNPARSIAAIQDKTEGKMYPVRQGDEILDRVQILSVEPRRVIFINPAVRHREFVEIPEDPNSMKVSTGGHAKNAAPIAQVEENKFVVKRSELDSQMSNYNALMTQARAVPDLDGGQMVGFKLMQIQPGSFYEKIGLKVGDTISAVNGEKITDVGKALALLQDLKNMNSLDLGIKRNGKEINLNYDIQ